MSEIKERLEGFVTYWQSLSGDEKGESQVFCDRLFQAFGHGGYKEAGATLEWRVKGKGAPWKTHYADLVWKPRVLIEMKKRGIDLELHFRQAFDYWLHLVPDRPRYVVLCNFDEFWIYDFDKQLDTPVDVVATTDLPRRYLALNFLSPENPAPLFGNDLEAVTREAAEHVAQVFRSLVKNGEDRGKAQRFILQTVVAMFAEDVDLIPRGLVSTLVNDCFQGASSYDLFGGLFRQMNSADQAPAGRFKGVPYFNGGLFSHIDPIELSVSELTLIGTAAEQDWSRVNPAIFGALFQASMDAAERHALGAHFTAERDIMKVILPSISRPWETRIAGARTVSELLQLRKEMLGFRVLDPACGSGNFLYMAYREMVRLEIILLTKIRGLLSPKEFQKQVGTLSLIRPRQFFGIDVDEFAVELAKITLLFGKKLALDEALQALDREQIHLDLQEDPTLPLENLDNNLICGDALFSAWPTVDVILGNPPYQSKNKMQEEFGRAYLNKLRNKYPGVPGRADYCVYWFRRAHDELGTNKRAGLVGTNTIRQNYSRVGGLDYITNNGGTITDAVSTQVWSGEAAVHVSIVNWIKGDQKGKKRLSRQTGDNASSAWESREVDQINSALSFSTDVTDVEVLRTNAISGGCYQGQTHGHEGFLLTDEEAQEEIRFNPKAESVLHPYLTAEELLSEPDSLPKRFVIDFSPFDLLESGEFKSLLKRVEYQVLPTRKEAAEREKERTKEALEADAKGRTNRHHANFLASWWKLSYPREEMLRALKPLRRYIVCSQVSKRPIFEFVSTKIRPNAALMVFPFEDDYTFGVLQSNVHWAWFVARCSTLGATFRYTSNTVFDTFPWPQDVTQKQLRAIADAGLRVRTLRRDLMVKHRVSLRELYRTLDKPGAHPLAIAHTELDDAVRAAYGIRKGIDVLGFLSKLNNECATKESQNEFVRGPGLPLEAKNRRSFTSADAVGS